MSRPVVRVLALAAVLSLAAFLAACGSSSKSTPTALNISVAEKGKETSFTVPKSVEGGLVELTVSNEGKAPHGAQLVRYDEGHTAKEVIEEISGESKKTPAWIRGEGGIGAVEGGKTGTATLNLEAGNFLVTDAASFGGPPATAEFEVTAGDEGDLPSTPGTITADEKGEDEYGWDISGLKAGKNEVTFNSEGDDAIHMIIAVPLKGKIPPLSQIKKDLQSEEKPPSYVEFEKASLTAVLDGGKSQTTSLDLKAGKYLFFCPLADRDGGKTHDQEGLLAIETIK